MNKIVDRKPPKTGGKNELYRVYRENTQNVQKFKHFTGVEKNLRRSWTKCLHKINITIT